MPVVEDPFDSILEEMKAIRRKKRQDYSNPYVDPGGTGLANLIKQGWEGVVVRMQDKMDRLNGFAVQSIVEGKPKPANETVEDTFLDAANYAILGLILYRQKISWRKSTTINSFPEVKNGSQADTSQA